MAMRNFPPRTNCFGVNQPDYCTAKYTFAGAGSNAAFTFDLSKWEGISFWARRGPDSQAGIRVAVGDQYTDDDIAYYMYREDSDKPPAERRPLFCDRVRECACLNHMPCTTFQASRPEDFKFRECPPRDGTYCGLPQPQISGEYQTGTTDVQCNTCERTRCDEHFPAFPGEADPQFNGRPCSPHTLRSGVYSAFCFDPALGEKPAEADQQCGDHWTAPVNLTDQWRLYLIPFERMLQQGFGKRAVKLDTSAVAVVRFTWEGGWIDYWIDNLGFYRRRPQP
jgi:hypothetical protein